MQKKGLLALLGAIGTSGFISTSFAANLLTNPTFESPAGTDAVDYLMTGWTLFDDVSRATFQNHTPSGTHALWLKTWQPAGGGVSQTMDIVGGSTYNVSAWTYFENAYPNTPAITHFSVSWLDASSAAVGTPVNYDILPGSLVPGVDTATWLQQTFTAVAPATAAKATLFAGWVDGGSTTGQQSAFIDDLIFDGPGPAPLNAWAVSGSGDWLGNANWSQGSFPNGVDVAANFLGVIPSPSTVYANSAVTVGSVKFDNTNTYVLAGAGSLKIDVSTGTGSINVVSGSHKINLPLTISDSTVATVPAGSTLTIADPLTLVGGATLTKSGAGTLEIISTTTTSAPAALLTSGGITALRMPTSTGLTLSSSGGETDIYASQQLAALNITGGTVKIDAAGAAKTVKTASISVGAGKLDITDNGLIVNYSGASPVESIRTSILSGLAGGNGIGSSTLTANTTIGYANASDVGSPASFMGDSVGGNAVLVRVTLKGDSNLSGNVNFDDLLVLAQNYGTTPNKRWAQGDSTHDGLTNFDDLLALAQNYNLSLSVDDAAQLASVAGSGFAADFALAQSLVPEPTSLLAVGSLLTIARRRR